jgi:putative ABC transport system ATP-binding protein
MTGHGQAPAVQVGELTVRFGQVVALRQVTCVVPTGCFLAVTGPSGAGKSTLLWSMAGALQPSSGSVRVFGVPVPARQEAARRGVGLVPQGNGLAAVLTATENILFPLLAAGVAVADALARTQDALAAVGLEGSGTHLVEELSGGQQQRVAVARGLALDPPLLLADEPTSELDHANRERVLTLLRERVSAGRTVVMATHDPEAAAVADEVLHLDEGVATVAGRPGGR